MLNKFLHNKAVDLLRPHELKGTGVVLGPIRRLYARIIIGLLFVSDHLGKRNIKWGEPWLQPAAALSIGLFLLTYFYYGLWEARKRRPKFDVREQARAYWIWLQRAMLALGMLMTAGLSFSV